MADNLLYVVFHGLISLVENTTTGEFRALLLEMSDHRVAAGHWLTESTMAKGERLELTGVDSGLASLDLEQNIILKAPQLNTGAVNASLFAEITLPKPREAHSFKGVDVQGMLDGADKNKVSSTHYSATQVFVYKMTGQAQDVTLTGQLASGAPVVHWRSITGTFLPQQGITVSVLHILNEPEKDPDNQHVMDEFTKSATLFGADLKLSGPVFFPVQQSQPPAGLLDAELLALSQREPNVFGMLAGLRQKTNTHLADAIGTSKVCGPAHGLVAA